jgi:hypothetical protein
MSRHTLAFADVLAVAGAVLAGCASAVGVFAPTVYRDVTFWAQQARGTDIATLFLGVPILLAGVLTAHRGSVAGRAAATAGLLYLVYNYAIFAFSVALNPLLTLYIGIFGLAVWSLALQLASGVRPDDRALGLPRRTTASVLIGVALVFALLWLGQIVAATLTGVVPADLERAELPTNPIYALDLGLFLPLCIVAAIGVTRRTAKAASFAVPMLIWLFLTSVGIVSAFVLAAVAGDEFAVVPAVLVSAIGVLTGALSAIGLFTISRAPTVARLQPAEAQRRWEPNAVAQQR